HLAAGKFNEQGVKLNPWQSVALWHSCRAAKERLLASEEESSHTISVLGRGSKLIGGTRSIEVTRAEVVAALVDGFFPRCAQDDRPVRQRQSGFQELGLTYESDTAITRHVAAFLADHGEAAPVRPTHVLFNGGVFKSAAFRTRLLEVLCQ